MPESLEETAAVGEVVTKTGATVWAWGMFYKAITQSVLLYGIKSLVVTRAMLKALEGLYHQAARHIAWMAAYCTTRGDWY